MSIQKTLLEVSAKEDRAETENQNSVAADKRRDRLLQEADDLLAQSYLIFLYSDLRLLSATGRVRIKFEHLSIDSDNVQKNDAAQLAVLPSEISVIRKASTNEGISPAQIMAALLVELRREVQARRRLATREVTDEEGLQSGKHGDYSILTTISDRRHRKKVEEDMDSLLKAYNYMIGMDLKAELPNIKARASIFAKPMQILKGGDSNQQEQGGAGDKPQHSSEPPLRPKLVRTKHTRDKAQHSSAPPLRPKLVPTKHTRSRRLSLAGIIPSFNGDQVGEVGDALFNMDTKGGNENLDRNLTEEEILDQMEDAVQSRQYDRLDFMRDFFREDSVSAVMTQSDTRIVWMNDWYPLKDLTYAVCVNQTKKEVYLVFRGAITKADWAHAANWSLRKVDNPIEEDYERKEDMLDIHAGFYRYLFRVRKDTGSRKYDEITTVVHEYGRTLIGEDYRLFITGHSLGAALSTVFGLFASTDKRFTEGKGPIKMYTFGSPYVGGKSFLEAFRHQEYTHKIQYLRMHNVRDGVAHMPIGWRGKYQHVGVSVKIHHLPEGCNRWRGQKKPVATYCKASGSLAL